MSSTLSQMSHASKTNVLNMKPNVSQLKRQCLTPLRQMSCTLKRYPTPLGQMS